MRKHERCRVHHRSHPPRAADRDRRGRVQRSPQGVAGDDRARRPRARRRRRLELAGDRSAPDLPGRRPRLQGGRRRRQRVRRLPQRLRRDGGRPRPSPKIAEIVSDRVRRGTHFAQPTEDSVVVGEHLSRALRPAALAVRQLGHRVHDGRRPAHARGDRDATSCSRSRAPTTATATRSWCRWRLRATRSATTRTRSPCRRRSGLPDAVVELTRVVPVQRPRRARAHAAPLPGPGRRA